MGGVLPYGQEEEPRPIPAFGRAGAPRPIDPGDNYPDAGGFHPGPSGYYLR
jgi:hypothetical protein